MTESDFNRVIDETLLAIEEAADASDADIDYENSGGVLTLTLGNGSQVIINRQTPVRQLWVAARSGGYHFDFDKVTEEWHRTSDGAELFAALSEVLSEQGGEAVALSAG
ncbi:MAG TPA: iron donor protein CyaY [Gammaproteobacteria bacterium]